MRGVARAALAGAVTLGIGGPASANQDDPDWPCVQRRVDHLSIGVMWPHPIPEDAAPLPADLQDVAAGLALRRVTDAEAREMLAKVATGHPDLGVEGHGQLFRAAFDRIDQQRSDIVAGIVRYARNQGRLAAEIEDLRAEMARLEAAEPANYDRMDSVETEIDWRVRVFGDRGRALTYVCESPVLLEQRAYVIAQMMLEMAD